MTDGAAMNISATTLSGPVVTLEPLRRRHLRGLRQAARGTDIWEYMAANLADTDSLEPWFAEAHRLEKAAQQLPFAIRIETGRRRRGTLAQPYGGARRPRAGHRPICGHRRNLACRQGRT